jgi:hypothetical protein
MKPLYLPDLDPISEPLNPVRLIRHLIGSVLSHVISGVVKQQRGLNKAIVVWFVQLTEVLKS